MGDGTYSDPTKPLSERKVVDKFITWLNAIDFRDDTQYVETLTEISNECNTRIGLTKDHASDDDEPKASAP